jgi:hypothetical protein
VSVTVTCVGTPATKLEGDTERENVPATSAEAAATTPDVVVDAVDDAVDDEVVEEAVVTEAAVTGDGAVEPASGAEDDAFDDAASVGGTVEPPSPANRARSEVAPTSDSVLRRGRPPKV